ncbi:MAG: sensor histidine kinase, partial [Betaproteobacteria bacterium]|nr:sensor histidine kinase [Betaproteobacteria bacterium]
MAFKSFLPYPRSFRGWLLAAFALVMLPLLLGLMYTAYAQQQLARQTRSAIATTVDVTRTTRQLSEDLSALQRAAGQYYVLQDPQLRVGMRDAHKAVQEALQALLAMPFDPADHRRIESLGRDEAALYQQLQGAGPADLPRFDAFAPRFDALGRSSDRIV